MNSTLFDILTSLALYTDIVQPGQKEIAWNVWWMAEDACHGYRGHVASMASPRSTFNRDLTSIVELGDMFLEDDDTA